MDDGGHYQPKTDLSRTRSFVVRGADSCRFRMPRMSVNSKWITHRAEHMAAPCLTGTGSPLKKPSLDPAVIISIVTLTNLTRARCTCAARISCCASSNEAFTSSKVSSLSSSMFSNLAGMLLMLLATVSFPSFAFCPSSFNAPLILEEMSFAFFFAYPRNRMKYSCVIFSDVINQSRAQAKKYSVLFKFLKARTMPSGVLVCSAPHTKFSHRSLEAFMHKSSNLSKLLADILTFSQ
mmetsp:Transcript_1490/g.2130  ORF Transcript_1490/g.2130 Transcript_1490/m.2130 type:complete len:236 (+) Transcript_1490:306-1013(+)